MDNLMQNEAEMKALKYETSYGSSEGAEMSEGLDISMRDPDTMVSVIVLLVACLGLAALAHVFV